MYDPNPSPPLQEEEDPLRSDAVSAAGNPPLTQETPILSDPRTAAPVEENIQVEEEEDDDEEGDEIEGETLPPSPIMDLRIEASFNVTHVSSPDVTLASPTGRRGGANRKKKGKAKSNAKRKQAIEEKLQNLRSNLNPVPFIGQKNLGIPQHEKLLKMIGLWEFVHIDFDRTIRVDFIAQLVANYDAKLRYSYVNGYRVKVNRADLGRALKLPLKKDKSSGGGSEVDLDSEVSSDESRTFITKFVSDWMLLHEDMWMMPNEVNDWMKMIREGDLEKVDWAGLLWFMVEKELKQGGQLKDCYYASHLQILIKEQHKEMFLMGDPMNGEVEHGAEATVVELVDNEGNVKDNDVVESLREGGEGILAVEEPNTELTLGKDAEKGVEEMEMVDAEQCNDSDEEGGGEEADEQKQWLLNGKNNLEEHFMQRCSTGIAEEFGSFEDKKDDEEVEEVEQEEEDEEDEVMDGKETEEEAANDFHVFPNDDSLEGDGYTGNFLQGMEANQMGFTSQEQLLGASSVDVRADLLHIASTPSFFNNSGKRVVEHDYDGVHDSNKRLRVNETWDNKPVDFRECLEQIEQITQRAGVLYEEKEQAAEQSVNNQQILFNELQKREAAIDDLHKARLEETQKKDMEIARLERELYLMESVVGGYKKALKEVQKAFAEYRKQAQLHERRRKIKEEEFKMNCLIVEQMMKEVEEENNGRFGGYLDKIGLMEKRLISVEANAKELIVSYSKKRFPRTEEEVHEVAETIPVTEPNEAVVEEAVCEPLPSAETEEEMAEAAQDLKIPESDEKVAEVALPLIR